jgi:hypothetical protein
MLKYVTLGLGILSGVLAFLLFVREPKIVKEVKTVEKKVAVNRVVYQDRTIDRKIYVDTGGHVVTQEHIVEKPVIHETINTVEKEKEVLTYSKSEWIVALNYTHLHAEPDPLCLMVYKRLIFDVYVGVGFNATFEPNFLNPTPHFNIENWSVGLAINF